MYKDLFSARRGKEQEGRAVSVINSAHRDFLMYLLWPSIYQTLINYSQTTPHLPLHCYSFLLFTITPGLPEAHILVPKMYKKQREPAILLKDHKPPCAQNPNQNRPDFVPAMLVQHTAGV